MRRVAAAALLVASAAILWFTLRSVPPATNAGAIDRGPRSILLVTLDTTRADRLAPYGSEDVATPTLSRLAREGAVFEKAWSVAPITLVAHSTILSGRLPLAHGVRNNGIHAFGPDVPSLAESLRDAGWRTGAFVSAAVLDSRYGLDRGFEVYDDDLSQARERRPRMVPDRPAEATVASVRGWLDQLEAGERFFAWAHFYDPHAPYSPPPPYRDRYRERLYDGEIAYLDAQLHQLLEHPRLAAEDTIVVVVGDHGESLGEHGEQTHALLAYDSTLHVPLIVRAPGIQAGMRVAAPASQVDLASTLLDLVDRPALPGTDGQSLVPLLEGRPWQATSSYGETYLPFYTYGWSKLRTLRSGRWKFIEAPEPELYDIVRDPRETTNLIDQEPGVAHDLARDLSALVDKHGAEDREAQTTLDADSVDQLRALGYLAVGDSGRSDSDRPNPMKMVGVHVGLERARTLIQDRLWEPAVRQLREILVADPGNLAAMIDLAQALHGSGDLEAALTAGEEALRRDPSSTRTMLLVAQLEAAKGRTDRALELLDIALAADPGFGEAAVRKASLLAEQGRRTEAGQLLEATINRNPSPRLEVAYAQIAELPAGRVEEAERRLRAALEGDPFMAQGWRALGSLLAGQGRQAEAIEAWRSGLQRVPDDADFHAKLGLALADSGSAGGTEAEVHLREAIRLSPTERVDLRVALGGWLLDRGQAALALRELERAIGAEPRHPGARNNLALALIRTGRHPEARKILEELIQDHPRHGDALNNLAALAIADADWTRAEDLARRAVAASPNSAQALNNLGVALDELGRLDDAIRVFERAGEVAPEYWQAQLNLALVSVKIPSRRQAGLDRLVHLAEENPNLAEIRLAAGSALVEHGDSARGKAHLNAYLRLVPSGPGADQARTLLQAL